MAQRGQLVMVMYVIEIIVIALLSVLLAGGFTVVALTGAGTGSRTGYGAGLMMIVIATTMGVGAGALHFHRQHVEDHSRLIESNARIERELQEMRQTLRTLVVAQAARNNAMADQLAERRNGRN